MAETDPHGLDQHQTGAKLDAGKVRPSLVLNGLHGTKAFWRIRKMDELAALNVTIERLIHG